jgi:hypothetical protein
MIMVFFFHLNFMNHHGINDKIAMPEFFSAYLHRFRMPVDESGGYKNLWYSFDYGLVHVVVINTETDFSNAPSDPYTTSSTKQCCIYIGGHVHWYERLYPIDANGNAVASNCNNSPGLIHITKDASNARLSFFSSDRNQEANAMNIIRNH